MMAEVDDGEVTAMEGFISHSKEDKSKQLESELGLITCKCGYNYTISEKGVLRVYCSKDSCSVNLLNRISNKITLVLKLKIS